MAWPAEAHVAIAALFGLLIGSFLNVVILRLPPRLEWRWRQDSLEFLEQPAQAADSQPKGLVVERSACPHCGHALAAWENIPLISYLLLRGRCRSCKTGISVQYPLVEALTAAAFAVCVWKFGLSWEALAACTFSGFLIAASGIDWRTTLLPDQLTLPLLWLGLLLSTVTLFVSPVSAILGAAFGYLMLWSVYWAFKLLTGKEGMGYGDFKLLAALGAWCGAGELLSIVLISSAVGAVLGSLMLFIQGRDRATQIPFGPYLAIAGWLQFIFAWDLVGWLAGLGR